MPSGEWLAKAGRTKSLRRSPASRHYPLTTSHCPQAEACEAQRKALLKESLAGPSPYEFAAEVAPSHADALLMRRTQDANMREVRRLINLLLKIKRYERQMEVLGKTAALHDVSEKQEVGGLE